MEQDLLKEKIKDMLASYEGKNYKKAESLALDISEKFPEQTLSLKILTMIYIYFNQIQKAFEISKKVIHLDPKDAETHNNIGFILFKLKKYDQSENSCKKALELKSDFAQAHFNLGLVQSKKEKLKDAEISYKKAIQIKINYFQAYNNLGNIQKQLDKLKEAEDNYRKALQFQPKYIEAQNNLNLLVNERKVLSFVNKGDNKERNLESNELYITNRFVEKELILELSKIKFPTLNNTKGGPLYGIGNTSNYNLFQNNYLVLKNVEEDLTKIIEKSINSKIYIMESFYNVLKAGSGSKIHHHITPFDRKNKLIKNKYSLVYYLSVGDQSSNQPGILKLYNPEKEILPINGMVIIWPADRLHSSSYGGKKDRLMIGINFYSKR